MNDEIGDYLKSLALTAFTIVLIAAIYNLHVYVNLSIKKEFGVEAICSE